MQSRDYQALALGLPLFVAGLILIGANPIIGGMLFAAGLFIAGAK